MENLELTKELYESPIRERNYEKYGDDSCICCCRPMKDDEILSVHMNTDWKAVHVSVTEENCEELTGAESQGTFPIGKSCAKKMGKDFVKARKNKYGLK